MGSWISRPISQKRNFLFFMLPLVMVLYHSRKVTRMLLHICYLCARVWSNPLMVTTSKKDTPSSAAINYQYLSSKGPGLENFSPMYSGILGGLILCRSCVLNHSWCEFMNACHAQKTASHNPLPHPLALISFLSPLLWCSLNLGWSRRECVHARACVCAW